MITIELIPHEVKVLAQKAADITAKIKAAIESNAAIVIADLIPGGEVDREALDAIITTAYGTCKAIADVDTTGVDARLQRLGADITKILHNSEKHTVSYYITSFEVVFHDLFGKL